MKAAGSDTIQSNRFLPKAFRIGMSAASNIVLTEILKSSIKETRPDGSGSDSWPSRHASWAYTASAIITYEFYDKSPWLVLGAQAAASGVAMQRVLANRHFPRDVSGGRHIARMSTALSYYISDIIFPGSRKKHRDVHAEWLANLEVITMSAYPLNGGAEGYDSRKSMVNALRFTIPTSDGVGLSAAAMMRNVPMYRDGDFCSMINSVGLSAGVAAYFELPWKRWSMECRLAPGLTRNFDGDGLPLPKFSFTVDAAVAASRRLTKDFALGFELGYSYWALDRGLSSIQVGTFTRKLF